MKKNPEGRYLLKQGDQFILHNNGQPCSCPFQPGIPLQDNYGRVNVQMNPCRSTCALFRVNMIGDPKKNGLPEGNAQISLQCIKHDVIENLPIVEEKPSPIIKPQA